MPSHAIYLSLGTNLGERLANLQAAIIALASAVAVERISPVYETQPWGYTDQPAFLNLVLSGSTSLGPKSLLKFLKRLEQRLGRTPTVRYGPRLIDLDILFYDDRLIDTPELTVPHPRLPERAFVLVPLADIAPDLVHPALGKSIRELLARVDTSGVKPYPNETSHL